MLLHFEVRSWNWTFLSPFRLGASPLSLSSLSPPPYVPPSLFPAPFLCLLSPCSQPLSPSLLTPLPFVSHPPLCPLQCLLPSLFLLLSPLSPLPFSLSPTAPPPHCLSIVLSFHSSSFDLYPLCLSVCLHYIWGCWPTSVNLSRIRHKKPKLAVAFNKVLPPVLLF